MNNFLPAEWFRQDAVQLTWPHQESDWNYMLEEAEKCFLNIAKSIAERQRLIIVTKEKERLKNLFTSFELAYITFADILSNDTWARDHGAITIFRNGTPICLNFQFNGWGNKFEAKRDNAINQGLLNREIILRLENHHDFVLEGGAIESDGQGTILTTSKCLLNPNRNPDLTKADIKKRLLKSFHANRILWLEHGELLGDDTDAHVDTLARFCNETTIAYVQCTDTTDPHFEELNLMEQELKAFTTKLGTPYKLVPLPHPEAIYADDDGRRLPATYANFLIINSAVLVPIYGVSTDDQALDALESVFPDREVIGINCKALIQQHGSLHCVTMQYPIGSLNL